MQSSSILVVDNEKVFVDALTSALRNRGFDAQGEVDALRVQQRIRKKHYDIILLDIIMPKHSGKDVVIDIRTYSPRSKIVMVSGEGTADQVVECLKLGANDYISKKAVRSIDELSERIQVVMKSPGLVQDVAVLRDHLIKTLWANIRLENAANRGDRLEQLLKQIFESILGFLDVKTNVKTSAEEIDIEFVNNRTDAPWSEFRGVVIAECKHWKGTSRPGRSDFDSFYAKLERRTISHLGFFASYNGVSAPFIAARKARATQDRLVAVVDREDLENLVTAENREVILRDIIKETDRFN